ncbi:argininosuccinate lyase [Deinococcus ruber]|uniref:argininosuccinate lyase n=1 Tax=Deinococcus ruber TaxID=1848197 RepID=A0A918FEN1_9DEIO|nr:lyase family protein [Deinococcus ruber]GGR29354.1 argininosuccinate lyase [Deinococcus ruber]
MKWHPVYLSAVLEPDYAYARAHLLPQFLDALTAHALGRLRVGTRHAQEAVNGIRALQHFQPPVYDAGMEDLFFLLDRELAAASPLGAGALRTALSRNDLDMTVYRLSARASLLRAAQELSDLRRTLLTLAAAESTTIMIAYSHHQPAQPITLGHYLAAVENGLSRDSARLHAAMNRLNRSPLGAVALAGSSHALDRDYTAQLLAFDGPIENTYDAVSTGDWQLEIAGAVSTCAVTLSRVLYDLLNWASQGLLSLADGLVQGSSVMPQKRNPVALEHARTRFSKALGYAQAVVYSNHNTPFGDINDPGTDIQEPLHLLWQDFSQGVRLLDVSLANLYIERDLWNTQAEHSDVTLTELADTLARQSGDFRAAHDSAQKLLGSLRAQGRELRSATDDDLKALGIDVPAGTVQDALNPRSFIERRTTFGGPAPAPMQVYFTQATARLEHDTQTERTWKERFAASRALLRGDTLP